MLTIKDLKKGEYYYIIGDRKYISITVGTGGLTSGDRINFPILERIEYKFEKLTENTSWRMDIPWEIRLATKEEKKWLDCCITSNKFIPLEEIEQEQIYNIFNMEPIIGEYYIARCLGSSAEYIIRLDVDKTLEKTYYSSDLWKSGNNKTNNSTGAFDTLVRKATNEEICKLEGTNYKPLTYEIFN